MQRRMSFLTLVAGCLTALVLLAAAGAPGQAETPSHALYLPTLLRGQRPSIEPQPRLVGQLKGGNGPLAVMGAYALFGAGDRLLVVDVATPSQPRQVGALQLPDYVGEIVVAGRLAYVGVSTAGLHIVDLSDPTAPRVVGRYEAVNPRNGEAEAVDAIAVTGHYAYVTVWSSLHIVDVSNPAAPRLAQWKFFTNEDEAPIAVTIAGGLAYVSVLDTNVKIYDISNPAQPRWVSAYELGRPGQVVVRGQYAYLANDYAGVQIVDMANPAAPRQAGVVTTTSPVRGIAVAGPRLYVATQLNGVRIVDVSDPAAPREVGAYASPTSPETVVAVDNTLYVMDEVADLRVVDVTAPAAPREVGAYDLHAPDDGDAIALVGHTAYVSERERWGDGPTGVGRLWIIDVSDRTAPRGLGFYPISGSLTVADHTMYVATGEAGLRILDLSDPVQPREVGAFTGGKAYAVQVVGHTAYVTSDSPSLRILDVADPTRPVQVGAYEGGAGGSRLAVVDGRVYVNIGTWEMRIVDVTDSTAPRELGRYKPAPLEQIRGLAVSGHTAYLGGERAFHVVDVSDPAAPRLVSATPLCGAQVMDVQVRGRTAFATSWASAACVIDVSDPRAPRQVSAAARLGGANKLAVDDETLYSVGFPIGLRVYALW